MDTHTNQVFLNWTVCVCPVCVMPGFPGKAHCSPVQLDGGYKVKSLASFSRLCAKQRVSTSNVQPVYCQLLWAALRISSRRIFSIFKLEEPAKVHVQV